MILQSLKCWNESRRGLKHDDNVDSTFRFWASFFKWSKPLPFKCSAELVFICNCCPFPLSPFSFLPLLLRPGTCHMGNEATVGASTSRPTSFIWLPSVSHLVIYDDDEQPGEKNPGAVPSPQSSPNLAIKILTMKGCTIMMKVSCVRWMKANYRSASLFEDDSI